METPEAQGGGTWTGNEAGRGGTGPISPAGGGTSTGGESASGGGGPGTGSGSDAYVASQFAYIRGLIVKNLVYPGEARRAGLRGKVTVGFIIIEDGLARNIRIVESSGHDLLDRTVLDAIRRCQPFPRPPGRAELVIPIVFKLK
ncbi:MAG: energy transducer TonB [Syntrophorhabdales bacterium]